VVGRRGASLQFVELIDAASADFERVVRRLPTDSWDRPTPSEISVRELTEHVVVGNRFTALLLAGVDRDEARAVLTGDQLGDDPVAAVIDSARRQAQAFAVTPPGQPVAGPNGDVPAEAYLRFRSSWTGGTERLVNPPHGGGRAPRARAGDRSPTRGRRA
jgi:hypothetical protein